VHGDFDKEVAVPTTIEDIDVVSVARQKIREYFESKGKDLHKSTETRAKL
jgi:propionyl-CoA synthetase